MMRRLRYWFHAAIATLNEWRYAIRNTIRDWYEVAVSPFRAVKSLRPADVVDEVRFGSHQFFGVIGNFFRLIGELIAGFIWFVIRLPINVYRLAFYGPRRAWDALRTAPPRLVAIVVAVSLTAVGAVGATGGYLWWEHRREFQRNLLNRQLDYQIAICDIDAVESTLVALQKMAPDDPSISARLEGIRAREAPLNDPNLIRVVMRTHYRFGAYDLAAREASKLIESLPADWEARCMLADQASRRDDKSSVRKHLSVLPRPFDVADSIQPWVAWYSAVLFQRIGETARYDEMVDFIVLNVLPLLRSKDVGLLEHDAKLLLLECYRLSL